MDRSVSEFTSLQVTRLAEAMRALTITIGATGDGVGQKVEHAADRVEQSTQALIEAMAFQGKGLADKLDRTTGKLAGQIHESSKQLADAMDRASAASEAHARSLSRATWALVTATVVLVLVTSYPLLK